MSLLFEPLWVGSLSLSNRIMRSATAERLVEPSSGAPLPRLGELYLRLSQGGVGLIVTGHAYVHGSGRAHPEMSSIAEDALTPVWREIIRPAQQAGARVMMQLNHCGASCDPTVTPDPLSPSGIATNDKATPRVMTEDEILMVAHAFGEAARRAREAGFDGVQIHGAHGYLINQFLMPGTNRREDDWGGDAPRRRAFLRTTAGEIRRNVGEDYPVWIKLGVAGHADSGLTASEGAAIAATCGPMGIECVEISHALGLPEGIDPKEEAAFLPLAEAVRAAVGPSYPLALVYGFRSRQIMEQVLESGVVQVISLCRPLIREPQLPNLLRQGADRARCVRCGQCWPQNPGDGIGCHHPSARGD
jgi:2,4-dienoyl-CoA reductase-like NADH-dependent reductase (Old Yellow Enzyme family)